MAHIFSSSGGGGNPTSSAILALASEVLIDPMQISVLLASAYLSWHGSPGAGFKATAGGAWPDRAPDLAQLRVPVETWPAVMLAQDAALSPIEVATWLGLAQGCYRRGHPESGFDDEEARGRRSFVEVLAENAGGAGLWPPALLLQDAQITPDFRLPARTVVYIDGPYREGTGYDHAFPRAKQVVTALAWKAAGARVYVSEAEPVAELVERGWFPVEITNERIGQARTFSKSAEEWVTCSEEPAWRPHFQARLF